MLHADWLSSIPCSRLGIQADAAPGSYSCIIRNLWLSQLLRQVKATREFYVVSLLQVTLPHSQLARSRPMVSLEGSIPVLGRRIGSR